MTQLGRPGAADAEVGHPAMAISSAYVEAYCPSCGETVQAHAETGRCQRCGRHAAGALDPRVVPPFVNGSASSIAPPALTLPDTAATRRWVSATQSYVQSLSTEAVTARAALSKAQAASRAIDATLAALSQVLDRLGVPRARPASPASTRDTSRLHGRWARAHEACLRCGRTDRKHKANGLCTGCHHRPVAARPEDPNG